MQQNRVPSLEEVAAEALVSRATAYRYFPNLQSLLLEASLDVAIPEAAAIFDAAPEDDPVARLDTTRSGDLPRRQNRRTPLIEEALKSLTSTLALILGTEAMVVFKDVLQLDDAQARKVKRWAIRALVEAAQRG